MKMEHRHEWKFVGQDRWAFERDDGWILGCDDSEIVKRMNATEVLPAEMAEEIMAGLQILMEKDECPGDNDNIDALREYAAILRGDEDVAN
jgi:hypothetical protein